jgi:hypothetical protein
MVYVGAVDADIVQLAVRVGGQLAHYAPIDLAGAKVTTYERKAHRRLHLLRAACDASKAGAMMFERFPP